MLALSYPCAIPWLADGALINDNPFFALIAWIAPTLLIAQLQPNDGKRNFLKGFLFGLACNFPTLFWVTHSMVFFGNLNYPTSLAILSLMVAYLSLYPALWALLYPRLGNGWRQIVGAAALWTLLEYCRAHAITGFPWCDLGYTQWTLGWFIQSIDVIGVMGLSAVVLVINLLILGALRDHSRRRPYLTTLAAIVLLQAAYGAWKLHQYRDGAPATTGIKPPLRVGLVQGNIAQNLKWQASARQKILSTYEDLSVPMLADTDLIVWPEASYPHTVPYNAESLPGIHYATPDNNAKLLLVGAASYIPDSNKVMNSLFAVTPDGTVKQRYDKIHLVMYGEYVPLAEFGLIRKLAQTIGNFTAGETIVPLRLDKNGHDYRFGSLICYETVYPELARDYVKAGVGLLVGVTNDAWFGHTSGPYQHLNIARFRAIENRRYLVRAANTGISAVISPDGTIQTVLPLDRQGSIGETVPYLEQRTVYSRIGLLPCGVLWVVAAFLWRRRNVA